MPRLWLLLFALALAACGGSAPNARVGARVASLPPPSGASSTTLSLAPESLVEVVGSDRVTGEHVATIRALDASVQLDAEHRIDSIRVVADLTTLEMRSAAIEEFVKSEDFLDVARYPKAVFVSSRVEAIGKSRYAVRGVLELHGVMREIEFEADLAEQGRQKRLSAGFLLPRLAFDLRRRDGWDFLISDDFRVRIEIVGDDAPAIVR